MFCFETKEFSFLDFFSFGFSYSKNDDEPKTKTKIFGIALGPTLSSSSLKREAFELPEDADMDGPTLRDLRKQCIQLSYVKSKEEGRTKRKESNPEKKKEQHIYWLLQKGSLNHF